MKRSAYWRNKFFSVVLIVLFTVLISACTPGGYGVDPPSTPTETAPAIISANSTNFTVGTVGTFTVTATGTPTPTFAITGTLPLGVTFNTTTGVLSGRPATRSIGTYPLTITASNGVAPAATQNFTLTVSLSAFNTSCLPLAVTDAESYGSFTFDANRNLLFLVSDADEIRSLDRNTCTVSTVATGVSGGGRTLLGMTYDQDSIYVGDDIGNIYKVDPTTGSSTLLTSVAESINGLAIAPTSYSPYGEQLIVVTYPGHIYAVDQSLASPAPVLTASIGDNTSALVFGSDGTLYVASYDSKKIVTVTAAGVVTDFVTTGLNGPDGLAFDTTGGLLYVTDSNEAELRSVTIPGGVVSNVASFSFNGGWYPSPIIYDAASNILLMGVYGSGGELSISNYNL